jgi:hypothetical protein
MASKKLKRAGKVAAAIGAAYLASQALGKKKPTSAEAKGLKITRAKKFGESDEGQMARLDAAQQRGLEITRSKPFAMSDEASPAIKENVPASKFLSTPGGFGSATPEQVDAQMEAFGPMAKKGKFISKKGKKAKDMSEEHEGMESEAEERKEYAMEEKGYKETSSGKMKKMKFGGSVVARGNKIARSKPTKLF